MSLTNGRIYIVSHNSASTITDTMTISECTRFIANPTSSDFTYNSLAYNSGGSSVSVPSVQTVSTSINNATSTKFCYFAIIFTETAYANIQSTLVTMRTATNCSVSIPWATGYTLTADQFKYHLSSQYVGGSYYYCAYNCSMQVPPNKSSSSRSSVMSIFFDVQNGTTYDYALGMSVTSSAYTVSDVYSFQWNRDSNPAGTSTPITSSATYICTLTNNERTDTSVAAASSSSCALKVGNGTSSFSGTYGTYGYKTESGYIRYLQEDGDRVWDLEDASVTAMISYQPSAETGTGYRSVTTGTSASLTPSRISSTGYTIYPGQTLTFIMSVSNGTSSARQYLRPYISFTTQKGNSVTQKFSYNGFIGVKMNAAAPSGAHYLKDTGTSTSTGAKRVMDFQHDVEDAGSSSMTSNGYQPVLTTVYNDNYDGHLRYNQETSLDSKRFRCLDTTQRIDSVYEYVSGTPTTTYTLVMDNPEDCVGCGTCNPILAVCPSGISVLSDGTIDNADQCIDCQACFNAGLNSVCPTVVTFSVE